MSERMMRRSVDGGFLGWRGGGIASAFVAGDGVWLLDWGVGMFAMLGGSVGEHLIGGGLAGPRLAPQAGKVVRNIADVRGDEHLHGIEVDDDLARLTVGAS